MRELKRQEYQEKVNRIANSWDSVTAPNSLPVSNPLLPPEFEDDQDQFETPMLYLPGSYEFMENEASNVEAKEDSLQAKTPA